MARKLVVTHAFGDFNIGDEITEDVEKVLETHRHAVVPVEVDDPAPEAEEPAPPAAPAKKS